MQRRRFLQQLAGATAAIEMAPEGLAASRQDLLEHHTRHGEFRLGSDSWQVYEDLTTSEGSITFVSSQGTRHTLEKSAEATFAEAEPPYLALNLADIGTSGEDLLANKLLANGDPDPKQVRSAAPPMGSASLNPGIRPRWNTFVGTVECSDTMPVFPTGNTRTYHPAQYFPELTPALAQRRYEGLVGAWMPAVRKVMPKSETAYYELLVFGDVEAHDRFIVQTWHRTALIENGQMSKAIYGYSYPAFPPSRTDPDAKEFYRALLIFTNYWNRQLADAIPVTLPDKTYVDMSRHAFAKELMVRPGGVYPKYGAVDRDYYGPEYDGFQDIFTSAVYTNLEWGRFDQARRTIDNYFQEFVNAKGAINMRGPETAQFGLTLSLIARYYEYTRDRTLLEKHREKIAATAGNLAAMHDDSLKRAREDPGYGLIHGWSESDACLTPQPMTWWQPYFANSAFAARGFKDISRVWDGQQVEGWRKRARTLEAAVTNSIEKNIRRDMQPPYIGPLPGATLTFRESMERERPSPQQWPHRAYAELLQADVLPHQTANLIVNCMRAYGATTLGVVANVGRPRPNGRAILGFISYGYAQMLLRLDRIEEYLLFLYSHRFHDHSRGSWTAGEVAGINGGTAIFCIPAQQTIPLLTRWMLVLEDSDEDRLYFGKGLPREWVGSGKEIRIEQAPTRWGRVNFSMSGAEARVELAKAGAPRELHVKFRLPVANALRSATVDGRPARIGGLHNDTVIIETGNRRSFVIAGKLG